MTTPKKFLKTIYRTPLDRINRIEYIRLDKNENLIQFPSDFMSSIREQITSDFVSTYPQVSSLYEKLAASLGVAEEFIFISTGSEGAIKSIFEAYINPRDQVFIPDPTYAMYEVFGELFQVDITKIPYDKSLNLDLNNILEQFTKKTKLVILANPNSPTGTIIQSDVLESFIAAAEREKVLVLIDEAYYPYYPHSIIHLVKKYPNLIVTRSFSKAYGLAALRLGYAVAQPTTIQWLKVFRPMYEANGFGVLFANALLDNKYIVDNNVKMVTESRDYFIREIERVGLKTYESNANFVNIIVGQEHVTPIVKFFKNNKILIKPGIDHVALRECIRITIGSISQMAQVIAILEKYYRSEAGLEKNKT
jgi:histidinol-phosphate aminotransferase